MARILAKALNCAQGPTPKPDGICHACVAIANGTSLDVIEMDAASQRGIDDIREIRERVVLQPAEGRYKVYILDEAHQLTDAAWNALLKLIEEPPPHLVFVFCTTELAKVLPTVRSRCQTFVFAAAAAAGARAACCGASCDGEGIEAPDAALALIARGARGSFRDAVSTLDQLAAATENADRRPVGAPAARRGRGGRALPALRRDRRPRHRRRARLRRGARGAGPGSRRGSSPTCSSTCGTCCSSSTWARCPTRCRSPRRRASGCASRRTSCREPTVLRLCRPARRRGRGHAPGRRPAAAARARAREGDAARRPTSRASRSPSASSSSSSARGTAAPAPAATPPPERTTPVAPQPRSGDASRRPSRAPAPPLELDAAPGRLAAQRPPGRAERSIPVASLLGEARPSALDGDTLTLEFPAERGLPPPPGRGAEERRRAPRRALRGDRRRSRSRSSSARRADADADDGGRRR